MSSVEKFARRQRRLEKSVFDGSTQPRLPYSAIDGGTLTIKDIYGDTQGYVGQQWDGSVTVASVGGSPPAAPSQPFVTPRVGGLTIYWDGTYVDDSPTRMDFRRVTFHAVTNPALFDPTDAGQIVGHISIATGGEITAFLPPVEYFVYAVAWSDAGKFSAESDPSFATPLAVVDPTMWAANEAALADLNDVKLPALQSELDASQVDISTLKNTSLPALQAELDASQVDISNRARVTIATAQPTGLTAADRVLWLDSDDGYAASYWNGTAWGPYSLGPGAIAADAITAAKIAAGAIIATKISADAVVAGKIAADAITAREIAADSITASEIAADAVTAVKILAGSVTATKIGADAVTAGKIAADAITAREIAADAITASEIAADAVTANELAANSVIAIKIAADAVTAGKIAADAITAREIAADAITANEIQAGAVTASELAVGAVTADKIQTGVLEAGYTLTGQLDVTGAIRVADSSWTPEQGLVFPGSLVLPSVAGSPASINANITARSLTVEKDLNILGTTNKVSGQLVLANGVTNPTVAPTVFSTVPSVSTFAMAYGSIYYGAVPHHSDVNIVVTAEAFYGGKIQGFDKTTGAPVYLADQKAWGTGGPVGFNPYGGITRIGTDYFVLGQDSARSYNWYIYKLDSSFNKVAEYLWYGGNPPGRPAIGNDGTNIMTAFTDGTSTILVNYYSTALAGGASESYNLFPNLGNSDMSSVAKGAFDFGTTKVLLGVAANGIFVTSPAPSPVRDDSLLISPPAAMRGSVWLDGRFWTFDKDGRWYKHGKNPATQSVVASYTWYDGNATGGTHETMESPASTAFSLPPRSWVGITTQTPPDSGSSAVNVDKANQVGIYAGVAGGARRRQAYPGLAADGITGITTYQTDLLTTNGIAASSITTNGFVGSTTSPGSVKSADGSFVVNGDGTGSWAAVRPAGEITMFGGAAAPNGWLLCRGQSVLRTDYPQLFIAIGTTYGSVDGTHFSLPNFSGRGPMGVGSADSGSIGNAYSLGQKFGHEGTQAHGHNTNVGWAENPTLNWTFGNGTTPRNVNLSSVVASSSYGAGNAENISPILGVNFIIKT